MADLSLFDVTGKKALVTGAAVGIGRGCAVALARPDSAVARVYRQLLPAFRQACLDQARLGDLLAELAI